jgi:hypothetical protein
MEKLLYAGIGARKTPAAIMDQMTLIATQLEQHHWILRSGNAYGADKAFQKGIALPSSLEIHLPWEGYNDGDSEIHSFCHVPVPSSELVDIAARNHPNWDNLSQGAKLMMLRNVTIVLGLDLKEPVKAVICWTPNGKMIGGTSHAIRAANEFNIPVFNIAIEDQQKKLCEFATETINSYIDKILT